MNHKLCESCGLPAAPHNVTDCFKELVRKRKIADEMFNAAVGVVHKLGDPQKIKDKVLQSAVLSLDLATWHYAM